MKTRPDGFLAEDKIERDNEIFDYIRELHGYLWDVVWIAFPDASGNLSDYIDDAINKLRTAKKPARDERYYLNQINQWITAIAFLLSAMLAVAIVATMHIVELVV